MEAWKFVNYSSLSPPCALSLTTERWGFEAFPSNLVTISGYWQDIKGSNNTVEPAWAIPYSCSQINGFDPNYYYYYNAITNISGSANICPESQHSASSSCIILIEGVGQTTVGPANSNILGLTHGISFLVIITTTIAIIMGCMFSSQKVRPPSPEPSPRPHPRPRPRPRVSTPPDLTPYVKPAPRPQPKYLEPVTKQVTMAKEVAECSGLLRQMYALELSIWGMEGNIVTGKDERVAMKHKVNMLFNEVRVIIGTWDSVHMGRLSAQEREQIANIRECMNQHGARRYDV